MIALHMPGAGKDGNEQLVPKIKQNGWHGGIISISNPYNPDPKSYEFVEKLKAIDKDVRAVIAATGYAGIRLSAWVPVESEHWQKLAKNPRNTYGPYNPDKGMWDAQVVWLKAVFAQLRKICEELGVPVGRIFVEYANERGIGGVNAALVDAWSKVKPTYLAFLDAWAVYQANGSEIAYERAETLWHKVFLPWTWNDGPMPEGWVPDQTWEYLRYIRGRAGLGGLRGIGYTSEASTGEVGETELESMSVSKNALDYLDLFEFPLAINHYSKTAKNQWVAHEKRWRNLTPLESASEWAVRLEAKCDRARRLLALYLPRPEKLNRIPVMEAGFLASHAPSNVAQYRRAYVDRMQMIVEGHPFIGWFTGLVLDGASTGNNLYTLKDNKLTPVDGEVGPNKDYDGSLEAAA